jgi:hypothetical protein
VESSTCESHFHVRGECAINVRLIYFNISQIEISEFGLWSTIHMDLVHMHVYLTFQANV